jgi:hypothetical protein
MPALKNLVAPKQIWQEYHNLKKSFSSVGVWLDMSVFFVDLMWNDPTVKGYLPWV